MTPLRLVFALAAALVALPLAVLAEDFNHGEAFARRELRACGTDGIIVQPCQGGARDVIFILDTSNSLDPQNFYQETLNYVQDLFCAFGQIPGSQAGALTFSSQIKTTIPLGPWTESEWFSKVEDMRSDPSTCCSCCTPTAEALNLALQMFKANGVNPTKVAYVITDGYPYQNSNGPWAYPKVSQAEYAYNVVPEQSLALKKAGVRVYLVGVPSSGGRLANINYFKGVPDPSLKKPGQGNPFTMCWEPKRSNVPSCGTMKLPPFPIVSAPVNTNIIAANNYSVQYLIDLTTVGLCATGAPVTAPTTKAPTTPPPTNKPTLKPTTLGPTPKPTTTGSPTQRPTLRPTPPNLAELDLFIILDSSRSMQWHAAICDQIPGGQASPSARKACWGIFVDFVGKLAIQVASLKNPVTNKALGWQGDGADDTKGLRLTLIGFRCAESQTKPISQIIGKDLDTEAKLLEKLQWAKDNIVPDGGTCPHKAIDNAVYFAQTDMLIERPIKSVVMITDGVWYDNADSQKSTKGFDKFCMSKFALGLPGGERGTSLENTKAQEKQLKKFVAPAKENFYNFGSDGFTVLDDIAVAMAQHIPFQPVTQECLETVKAVPYWCGYTTIAHCEATPQCKWVSGLCKVKNG